MAIREKGKLRDLGMAFKPSFKCLKNTLKFSDSKTRNFTLSEYIYIYYFILYYFRRAILIQKKSGLTVKNMPYLNIKKPKSYMASLFYYQTKIGLVVK
jgi:hypothetical protein